MIPWQNKSSMHWSRLQKSILLKSCDGDVRWGAVTSAPAKTSRCPSYFPNSWDLPVSGGSFCPRLWRDTLTGLPFQCVCLTILLVFYEWWRWAYWSFEEADYVHVETTWACVERRLFQLTGFIAELWHGWTPLYGLCCSFHFNNNGCCIMDSGQISLTLAVAFGSQSNWLPEMALSGIL